VKRTASDRTVNLHGFMSFPSSNSSNFFAKNSVGSQPTLFFGVEHRDQPIITQYHNILYNYQIIQG
jgi:hypothetical protein